jgi:hypothetical protein
MEEAVSKQLVGDQKRSNIGADTLTSEAFEHLAEAASLLVQEDRLMQPSLMEAVQVGILRSSGEISTQKELVIETENFGVSAVRFSVESDEASLKVESTGETG